MTLIRKLASALLWVLLFTNFSVSKAQVLDPSQIYTTGNIVLPTITGSNSTPWVNGVYQDSLTCWAWGNPGYCGPNAIVRPDGNINFSFGMTNLYQIQAIASVLPDSGTGLRVNGYNFNFTAKNGNGWDDGRLDYLTAYVSFYDPKGSTVYNKNYNLNYQFNWTTFNYSETFTSPYSTKNLGSVQYGFVGMDNNYWAGPYGPEINNVSFSLKYSVDPCFVNVLSSPSCPGYLEALAKLNPPVVVDSQPLPTTGLSLQSPSIDSYTLSTNITKQSQATLTSAQTSSSSATQTPSLSLILGIVRAEQSRISTVESSTVQQANEAASLASIQAQQTAERVALIALSSSASSSGPGTGLSMTSTLLQSPGQGSVITPEISLVGPSPIKDQIETALQNQQNQLQENQNQRQVEVKKNVQDNEAAGGVSIAMLAKQPPGYELYQLGMKDNVFYSPKEIYTNQKVIDNERLLRQLNGKSDRIHEEMVNEQYR